MLEPKSYTVRVTIRTEMWLREPIVYNEEGWVNPDFADLVIRGIYDDMVEGWIKPSHVERIEIKENDYDYSNS